MSYIQLSNDMNCGTTTISRALSFMKAVAKYLIDHGFQYWFDLEDIETLETHNEDFRGLEEVNANRNIEGRT